MSPLAQAVVLVCLVALTIALVIAVVALRRTVQRAEAVLAVVEREIRPLVRSSMINRTLYDWAGDRTYRALIRRFSASPNLPQLTRRWYRGLAVRHLLWPIAQRRCRTLKQRPERESAAYLRD